MHIFLTVKYCRYRWKTNLIEDTKKKMSENAVSWKEVDEDSKQSLHGRKIVLRGKFDHAKGLIHSLANIHH